MTLPNSRHSGRRSVHARDQKSPPFSRLLRLELLEDRRLLAAVGLTPPQVRGAYGIPSISDGTTADGKDQTIAIIDYGDDPFLSDTGTAAFASSDLYLFDHDEGYTLPDPPSFTKVGESGGAPPSYTGIDFTETTLDVEWAHAIAPGANILLIEMTNFTDSDIATAVSTAKALGASVVSMSFGRPEEAGDAPGGATSAAENDSVFTGAGISYVASTGDNGAPAGYPAFSPNVLAVGGTDLSVNSNNTWAGETGWTNPSGNYEIVDNSSPTGFADVGTWNLNTSGGEDGNYVTAAGGTKSAASWTFNVSEPLPPDTSFGLSLTWVAAPGNATNATYSVFDGSTLLGNLSVDQTKAPFDNTGAAFDAVIPFQEFANGLQPVSGQVTVVLNASSANGTVCADAVALSVINNTGGSSGGISEFETAPTYQQGLVIHDGGAIISNNGSRTVPDVSMIGGTPVQIIEAGQPAGVAGTSLSAPCWAGLVAIIDQGLQASHLPLLSTSDPTNGLQALLYRLYDANPSESGPASDFHDITSGFNGYSAGPGYDLVTGIGSPVANNLVPDIISLELKPPVITPSSTTAQVAEGGAVLSYATPPTISDPAQPLPVNDELQLSVTAGAITTSGATVVAGSNGTSSITVQGTFAQLDAVLAGLVYTSNGIVPAVLSITPIDPESGLGGRALRGITATVAITVHAPPVASNAFLQYSTMQNPFNLSKYVSSVTDPNGLTFTVFNVLGGGYNMMGSNGALYSDPGGDTMYTPPPNFIGGISFQYQAKSSYGLLSNIGTIVIIVGPTGTLSGYSYVDLNNDGIKESNEAGIQGVTVSVTGTAGNLTFGLQTQTQANGQYTFTGLPAGNYTITETEPGFFEHGQDTPGTPAPAGPNSSGVFANITLTGNATTTESGSGYNFAELGLRAQFVMAYLSERAFFASSEQTLVGFNASTGDVWVSLDAGIDGTLTATAAANDSGYISMTLYNNNLQPLVTSPASSTTSVLTYQGTPGQPYFIELVGSSTKATLQTAIVTPSWHNSVDPEDVLGLGTVTPADALAVINLLNLLGPGPFAGKQVPAGMMPDVLGTGILESADVLAVINALNGDQQAVQPAAEAPAAVAPAAVAPSFVESPAVLPADVAPAVSPADDTAAASPAAPAVEPAAVAVQPTGTSPPATPAAVTPAVVTSPASPAVGLAAAANAATLDPDDSAANAARVQFFASSSDATAASEVAPAAPRRLDPAGVAAVLGGQDAAWTGLS